MLMTAVRTLTSVLAPPSLQSAVTGSTATLTWVPPTPTGQSIVAGYRVYKAASAGGPFTQIAGALPPTQLSLVDTLPGTQFYRVEAFDQFQTGNSSPPISCSPQIVGGSIVMIPGVIGRTGSGNDNGFAGQLATVLSFIGKAIAADINNKIVGFMVPAYWAALEGPVQGVYDGSWGGSNAPNLGFAGVQQIINLLSSFSFKRFLMLSLNQAGNDSGSSSSTSFPSSFAPAYLATLAGAGGGAEWGGRSSAYAGYPNLNTTLYLRATALACAQMTTAYYSHFGPYNPVTGTGLYGFELTNEISMASPCMITAGNMLDAVQNGYSQCRVGAPKFMFSMRPTFINPNTAANYSPLCDALRAAKICMGSEDGSNIIPPTAHPTWKEEDWGTQAYRGEGSFAGSGMPNHATLNDWAFILNAENAEFGNVNAALNAVPPASKGTGLIYDAPASGVPGMMNGVNQTNAVHFIVFLDGQYGPNINRFAFPVTTGAQPANPTPGPGAGLTTARPHFVDVITGNTAQPGISGPLVIPGGRPTGW